MIQGLAIEVENLTKRYGPLTAVDGISFTVPAGEIFAFLGPNGAGKTTTIEILQGLRQPTSGRARVLGNDVATPDGLREIKRRVGVLPQEFNALDKLRVQENIALFAAMYPQARDPKELIHLLDLDDKAKTRFDQLSGGLKQRVGIAAALVNNPELVFLDEPTAGLDPKARRDVWRVIRQLKQEGRAVFLTTHYMEEAERLADRIAIINKGKIAAIGTTHELLEQHGGRRVLLIEELEPGQAEQLRSRLPDIHYANGTATVDVESLQEIGQMIDLLTRVGVTRGVQIRNPTIENGFLQLIGARLTEEGELA